jgi:hypothetical protein
MSVGSKREERRVQEREQVDLLLGEFGREIGLPGLALDEDGHAALAFDDVLVNFEVEEGDERLLLYAYLGEIRGDAAASMRAMLEANLFWRGADGGTLAMERATGGVVLELAVPTASLDRSKLQATLERFINTAEDWAQRIGEGRAAKADADAAESPAMMFRA